MATFVHDDGTVLKIRTVPALRVAIGFGLATSWLLHVFFELMEAPHNRHEYRSALWLGTTCVVISCLLSRLVVLRFDRQSQSIYRWSVSMLGVRRRTMPFRSIQTAEFLPRFAGEWIVLGAEADRVLRLGGLDWLNTDCVSRRRWLGAIRQTLWPSANEAQESVVASAPPVRFSLRRALIAVALAAIVLGVSGWMKFPIQSRLVVLALVVGCTLVLTTATRTYALLLVLAAYYFPFGWMIRESVPWGHTSGLISSLPLVPAMWLAWPMALAGVHPDSGWWLATVVPIQVTCAAWFAGRNAYWMLGVWLGSFVFAAAGSFVGYAMYRM